MTSLLESARKMVGTRRSELSEQLAGLEEAATQSRGRLPDELVDRAETIVSRADGRMRLSPDHTVVAIGGATGSGKSSTFNSLTGLDLAAVGMRRPTTSWATACIWGNPETAEPLLDWMGIPPRHRTTRDSMLDSGREAKDLKGLILLDLPDHDSTEVSHHLEVDRLVVFADLMIWVLDPQKYADAAIHEKYLKPLASHKDVMIIALNHIDEVPPDRRAGMIADVQRLLVLDGLEGVPLVATSARTGDGIAELKRLMTERVTDKKNARARFKLDVERVAAEMDEATGQAAPRDLSSATRNELNEAISDAAGVPVVVDAVRRATRMRESRATGWPPVKWVSRLRPDPLKRLHLDLGQEGRDLVAQSRSSIPKATHVQQARVDGAVRRVADELAGGMARPWADAVRNASQVRGKDFADEVDKAVTGTELGAGRIPGWCRLVQVLQWLLILSAIAGAAWLAALAVMAYLKLDAPATPDVATIPLPTVLLVGGLGLGLLLGLITRVMVGFSARARARSADRRLRAAIDDVSDRMVLEPIEHELVAYRAARQGIERARG